ncbi:hypothetical protein [Streptomyces sp. NBC_01320]|uniref:hypothetical protein n=1 Tax=Streptomyces sp. NBC_01320 TaxID=2903824 RepID=UPI003FA3BE50
MGCDRREQYADDLDADRSLVAVTAKTNRSKADRDPAEWLPQAASAQRTYGADWVATKLRWKLAADDKERLALEKLAAGCSDTVGCSRRASAELGAGDGRADGSP